MFSIVPTTCWQHICYENTRWRLKTMLVPQYQAKLYRLLIQWWPFGAEFNEINYVLMITILPWEQCDPDCSSHYSDVTWTWWCHRSQATRMDDQEVVKTHNKVNIKALRYLPFVVDIRWSSVDPLTKGHPDSKVHGTNMAPTWVLSAPDGPHIGPMNLAIRAVMRKTCPSCDLIVWVAWLGRWQWSNPGGYK